MRFENRKSRKQAMQGTEGQAQKKAVRYPEIRHNVFDMMNTPVQNCEKVGWRKNY